MSKPIQAIKQGGKELLVRVYSGVILVIWIMAPYLLLQQFAIRDVYWLEPTVWDRSIPINFYGLWFYFTYYILLGVVGLSVRKPVYMRFLLTVGWTVLVAHMVFLFFPNGVSREEIPGEGAPFFYEVILAYDAPRNAFPSLHAALAVIAGLAVNRCCRYHPVARVLVWCWVLGIFWSTIALRQHVLVDLLGGAAVAVGAWIFVGWFHRAEIEQMRDGVVS
ncbi:phosphatase PAP2 family protein [Rubritalea tangerina]|uniref:Phosphatase PAP2 family protein n=2 Tax=Rubritalea tangerina TaxID=430798 RepID=A0ABW4ZFJ8_9BACT